MWWKKKGEPMTVFHAIIATPVILAGMLLLLFLMYSNNPIVSALGWLSLLFLIIITTYKNIELIKKDHTVKA